MKYYFTLNNTKYRNVVTISNIFEQGIIKLNLTLKIFENITGLPIIIKFYQNPFNNIHTFVI